MSDKIAEDIFKAYHLNHTEPKFLLGQKVSHKDDPETTGRVVGYFSIPQMPDGHMVVDEALGTLNYVSPSLLVAVGG